MLWTIIEWFVLLILFCSYLSSDDPEANSVGRIVRLVVAIILSFSALVIFKLLSNFSCFVD